MRQWEDDAILDSVHAPMGIRLCGCSLAAWPRSRRSTVRPRPSGRLAPAGPPHPRRLTRSPMRTARSFSPHRAPTARCPGSSTSTSWASAATRRYLLVRYRAHGLSTNPAVYFLHGEEGTRGGMAYAMADDLQPDAQWHVLAVDLLALDPLEVTHQLALKVFVDAAEARGWRSASCGLPMIVPAEAQLARQPAQRSQEIAQLEWTTSKPLPREGWTTTPATDFSATPSGNEMTFHVRGPNKGMRWLVALPAPVDLGKMPYVSVRYKASGAVAATGYTIWLGNQESGAGGNAVIALPASDCESGWCVAHGQPEIGQDLSRHASGDRSRQRGRAGESDRSTPSGSVLGHRVGACRRYCPMRHAPSPGRPARTVSPPSRFP